MIVRIKFGVLKFLKFVHIKSSSLAGNSVKNCFVFQFAEKIMTDNQHQDLITRAESIRDFKKVFRFSDYTKKSGIKSIVRNKCT